MWEEQVAAVKQGRGKVRALLTACVRAGGAGGRGEPGAPPPPGPGPHRPGAAYTSHGEHVYTRIIYIYT